MVRKVDWPPLLAPGRHYKTLSEIRDLCVDGFTGAAFAVREKLFHSFEQVFQDLLLANIACQIRVDGSFVTEKPEPGDVDVIVAIDLDVMDLLSDQQRSVVDNINSYDDYYKLDISAYTAYPRGHPFFGGLFDADTVTSDYGIENGEAFLKGIAVMRLWETDVGVRINR